MPMFPDSGVPANEAKYAIDVNTPVGCQELWYSTARCQPRFDPAAANAMLAEDMNLIMRGELQYDCARLDHIERAVRYINQRGLPRALYMQGGPQAFWGGLDPAATRLNDYMTLTIVPGMNNAGPVTLDIGLGANYILRNDGRQLEREDLKVGKPDIIAFFQGNWYITGLVASQVPIIVKGGIDCWIRTDGNDFTGDGTANTPDKAFRTIAGCWNAVGSRFAATPLFSINMRLGIPGQYDGTVLGPFGGNVSLTGDPGNPGAYRIQCVYTHPMHWSCMWINGIMNFGFSGLTFLWNHPPPETCVAIRSQNSNVGLFLCNVEVSVSNSSGAIVEVRDGGAFSLNSSAFSPVNDFRVIGGGQTVGNLLRCLNHGALVSAYFNPGEVANYHFSNLNVGTAFSASGLSTLYFGSASTVNTNIAGPQYIAVDNSVINMGGKQVPGNLPGAVGTGGQFIP